MVLKLTPETVLQKNLIQINLGRPYQSVSNLKGDQPNYQTSYMFFNISKPTPQELPIQSMLIADVIKGVSHPKIRPKVEPPC